MSEEMQIDGKVYIPSKQAALLSTYAQDYIGQLARKSLIEAKRIGGLWYVSMESLEAYKKKAEEYKPTPPGKIDASDPEALVFFDGKEYLSAPKAAQETGYTQDYVGQLARSGTVLSRQVGTRWYIQRESVLNHKREKDALLAAVQSQAVGLIKIKTQKNEAQEYLGNTRYSGPEPLLTYHSENKDLIPITNKPEHYVKPEEYHMEVTNAPQIVAIRRIQNTPVKSPTRKRLQLAADRSNTLAKSSYVPLLFASAATIIIVLSIGYASVLRKNSVYATNIAPQTGMLSFAASADELFSWIGDKIEPLLTHELMYERPSSN